MRQAEITTDQKIDMIFSFLFNNDKKKEEEFFWNCLTKKEIAEIKKIDEEDDFMDLEEFEKNL